MKKLISYSEAARLGLPKYYTGKPCKNGHIAERRTSNQCCTDCEREKSRRWKAENPEKASESNKASKKKAWENRDKEETRRKQREKYAKNPEKVLVHTRRWIAENRERHAALTRNWAKRNRHLMNARDAMRRARELRATPWWLTKSHKEEIKRIYCSAAERSKAEQAPYEVDHIVPLTNDLVCGLHVPWNMQVIPASENRRKLNKFTPYEV